MWWILPGPITQDKALVESAVRLVYQRIFYPLSGHTFFSLSALNKAIGDLLVTFNDYSFQNIKTTRKARFLEIEKSFLQVLPAQKYYMRQYRRAKVQKVSHIYVGEDKNYYSVPHRYIGLHVEVQYSQEVVEIFYKHERIAAHPRSCRGGHYSTIKEHMPSSHQAYNSWNPAYFENRARKIGEYACKYIHRLIAQYEYPEVGYDEVIPLGQTSPRDISLYRIKASQFSVHFYSVLIFNYLEPGLNCQ